MLTTFCRSELILLSSFLTLIYNSSNDKLLHQTSAFRCLYAKDEATKRKNEGRKQKGGSPGNDNYADQD